MLRSKTTIRLTKHASWFFLGYLVLLLNFGPSLHHAPIFGLHGNPCDTQTHSSCCCHSHGPQKTLIPSLAVDFEKDSAPSVEALDIIRHADHSCAFCKFFDEYNVVVDGFECDLVESPISLFLPELPDSASAQLVPDAARGPPTA